MDADALKARLEQKPPPEHFERVLDPRYLEEWAAEDVFLADLARIDMLPSTEDE